MDIEYSTIILRLVSAVIVGGTIGLERAYHGRPAGFRTHTLVCTASSTLMLLMVYQWALVPAEYMSTVRVDPTRMAQGIMTGIGFLGAGVIMKESLTIRGLTTAASIWMTASIGIVIGMGFYFTAIVASVLTLGTLTIFSWIEKIMPSLHYAKLTVQFLQKDVMSEDTLCSIIRDHHISAVNPSYHLLEEGSVFQYQMTVRTEDTTNFRKLAEVFGDLGPVQEFSIIPIGD